MRQDVKLGVLVALGIVLIAGGYYLFRGKSELPIPVNPGGPLQTQAAKDKPAATPAAPRTADRTTTPRTVPGTRTTSPVPGGAQPAGQPNSTASTPTRTATQPPAGTQPTTPPGIASNPLARPTGPDGTPTSTPPTGPSGGAPAGPVTTADSARPANSTPTQSATEPSQTPAGTTSPTSSEPAKATAEGPSAQPLSPPDQPTGSAATPPSPGAVDVTTAATESYRVQEGDTYPSLAMMFYGDARYTGFLMRSNPQVTGGKLQPGQIVKIPPMPGQPTASRAALPPSVASQPTPGLASPSTPANTTAAPSGAAATPSAPLGQGSQVAAATRSYRVREGDSFYGIARDMLGDATRWQEVFEMNRDAVKGDPKRLRTGQTIRLPES